MLQTYGVQVALLQGFLLLPLDLCGNEAPWSTLWKGANVFIAHYGSEILVILEHRDSLDTSRVHGKEKSTPLLSKQ